MQKIEDLFAEMDEDDSGTISWDEFNRKISLLTTLGLDKDTMRLQFELIDTDMSGFLDTREFIHTLFRLVNPPNCQEILVIKRK